MTHATVKLGLPLLVLPAMGCTTMGTGRPGLAFEAISQGFEAAS
jgi:hypothetical protein